MWLLKNELHKTTQRQRRRLYFGLWVSKTLRIRIQNSVNKKMFIPGMLSQQQAEYI